MNGKIHRNITLADYAALPGVSITRLKSMGKSPKHYQYELAHPPSSPALSLGTLAHLAILEPARFESEVVVWGERTDGGKLRPKRGKDWEKFSEMHASSTICTEDVYMRVCAMRDAVKSDPNAGQYFAHGEPEVAMTWEDEETGMAMRGRVDWLSNETYDSDVDPLPAIIVGLKTTRDIRPALFGTQAARLGWHMQWACYHDGYERITGLTPSMVEIAVESAPPHDVAVYTVPEDVLELGRADYRELLHKLKECQRTGQWPGACPNEQPCVLPTWAWPSEGTSDLGLTGIEGGEDESNENGDDA
jgi:hypothetical protein